MFWSQRQLQALHQANGAIVLPYRAKLTPAAKDWVRAQKIVVGYGDLPISNAPNGTPLGVASAVKVAKNFAWWCDGPCGIVKAALTSYERENLIAPMTILGDATKVLAAVKQLARDVKSETVFGGILVVQHAGAAMLYANRCPQLRAVLGTSLEAVDSAIRTFAANVLVIEHPRQTLQQSRNLIGRFVKAPRQLADDVVRELKELASCG